MGGGREGGRGRKGGREGGWVGGREGGREGGMDGRGEGGRGAVTCHRDRGKAKEHLGGGGGGGRNHATASICASYSASVIGKLCSRKCFHITYTHTHTHTHTQTCLVA